MGSKSTFWSLTAWYSSMRVMPSIPMFRVISVALVLQGVTMLARGPIKKASRDACSIFALLPSSQLRASLSWALSSLSVCTAITRVAGWPKKWIMKSCRSLKRMAKIQVLLETDSHSQLFFQQLGQKEAVKTCFAGVKCLLFNQLEAFSCGAFEKIFDLFLVLTGQD